MANSTLLSVENLVGMWRSSAHLVFIVDDHGRVRVNGVTVTVYLISKENHSESQTSMITRANSVQNYHVGTQFYQTVGEERCIIDMNESTETTVVWRNIADPDCPEVWHRIGPLGWNSMIVLLAGEEEDNGLRLTCSKMLSGEPICSILVKNPGTTTWHEVRCSLALGLRPYLSKSKLGFVSPLGEVLTTAQDTKVLNDILKVPGKTPPMEVWSKYQEPNTGRKWYWHEPTNACFFQDSAAEHGWQQFKSPDGKFWWWNQASERTFFEPET